MWSSCRFQRTRRNRKTSVRVPGLLLRYLREIFGSLLAEYAPGAEVLQWRFPEAYIYRSAGIYDPSAQHPDYAREEKLNECRRCRAVTLTRVEAESGTECPECGSGDITQLCLTWDLGVSPWMLRSQMVEERPTGPAGGSEPGSHLRLNSW